RREDIPPLAQSFARRIYSLSPTVTFSSEAVELLERYPWPGNIRELENAVVRGAAMCDGIIRAKDLPDRIRHYREEGLTQENAVTADPENEEWPSLAQVEGRYVARVLRKTGGNKQAASRVLGVDRKTLSRMVDRHKVK
ncbi:MAG TPA: helix-turn-helix domain-containing protein, partial [Pyrinomonadaceae bacterium]|nr:helix-turn-helix domain-containing protein [Pyrinomonadaceae bacterium]